MKTSLKALACVAALACTGAAQAQDLPSSIWFDGYCDGFSDITTVGDGVVLGNYDLSFCPFYEGVKLPSVGAGGRIKNVGIDYTTARMDTTFFAPLFRLRDDGTATIYWPTGVSQALTWTAGPPQQKARSGPPALLAPR
ncbi:MAG: hypothetical protein LCH73_13705 [Proteobacteria bacterium]|nr:hypothetical protein [Pseudomonadota bacterium]